MDTPTIGYSGGFALPPGSCKILCHDLSGYIREGGRKIAIAFVISAIKLLMRAHKGE